MSQPNHPAPTEQQNQYNVKTASYNPIGIGLFVIGVLALLIPGILFIANVMSAELLSYFVLGGSLATLTGAAVTFGLSTPEIREKKNIKTKEEEEKELATQKELERLQNIETSYGQLEEATGAMKNQNEKLQQTLMQERQNFAQNRQQFLQIEREQQKEIEGYAAEVDKLKKNEESNIKITQEQNKQIQKLQRENKQYEEYLNNLKQQMQETQQELAQANKDVEQLSQKLNQANKDVEQWQQDLTQANNDVQQLNQDLTQANNDVKQLTQTLAQEKKNAQQLTQKLAKEEKNVQQLTQKMTQEKQLKDNMLKDKKEIDKKYDTLIDNLKANKYNQFVDVSAFAKQFKALKIDAKRWHDKSADYIIRKIQKEQLKQYNDMITDTQNIRLDPPQNKPQKKGKNNNQQQV